LSYLQCPNLEFESGGMGTSAGNEEMKCDALSFRTLGQVTELCDPGPDFGAGSRSLGDLAPGNTTGVSPFPATGIVNSTLELINVL